MTYRVVLKNLRSPTIDQEKITLCGGFTKKDVAESMRRNWRRILGNKHWHVDRSPGLDTLDHRALTVEVEPSKGD